MDLMNRHNKLSPWHLILQSRMNILDCTYGEDKEVDLFVIVRSRYERAVSEYLYLQMMCLGRGGPEKMNRYIAE